MVLRRKQLFWSLSAFVQVTGLAGRVGKEQQWGHGKKADKNGSSPQIMLRAVSERGPGPALKVRAASGIWGNLYLLLTATRTRVWNPGRSESLEGS